MRAFTRWVLAHQRLVVAFWVVVFVVGIATVQKVNDNLSQQFSLPGQEGYETNVDLLKRFGTDGSQPQIVPVLTLPQGTTVDSPGVKEQLQAAFAKIEPALPGALVASYASTDNRAFVSDDGRTTFGLVFLPGRVTGFGDQTPSINKVRDALRDVQIDGSTFKITGFGALQSANGGGGGPGVLAEALIGGFGALIVLAIVFGSTLAVLPLLMAVVAIMSTFLLIGLLTLITDINFIVEYLVALIGLGVAIDYSLLIVMRWREERAAGLTNTAAVQRTMETAGDAVIHSGSTVAVGLLALLVLPVPFLRSIGIGGVLIPLVSVAVAITVLPVLLNTIGPRIDWPYRRRDRTSDRLWTAWARLVVRYRWLAAASATVILAALLVAAFNITIGQPAANTLPATGEPKQALQELEQSGIGAGALSPSVLIAATGTLAPLVDRLSHVEGVRGVVAPSGDQWNRLAHSIVLAIPSADGFTSAGRATLNRIKSTAHGTLNAARVGGAPAETADFISSIYGSFPLMVVLIALVTFILLVRAFRSLLLPFKAVLLNVLSVGAAWGVMVLVWQEGYGSEQIWGIKATGAITVWIPLMVFAFLFGLSMDYEVFILARMREHYNRTGSTREAIIAGIGRTGRLVTFAALILFLAFASLASGPETDVKVFATGLAAGIILDATLVRSLLVPALVALLGRWNWWLPEWMARPLRVEASLPKPEREPVQTAT
jgi:RND superfamily putative drug exporter